MANYIYTHPTNIEKIKEGVNYVAKNATPNEVVLIEAINELIEEVNKLRSDVWWLNKKN
jgi:hypothetical protein